MSSYVRSRGTTFTKRSQDTNRLERGIRMRKGKKSLSKDFADDKEILPPKVAEYLKKDPDLLIRQVISLLDKVIRKPRILKDMALETYVDRTKLAVEIWSRLEKQIGELISDGADPEIFKNLTAMWLSKIHPYATQPFDPKNPGSDENASFIKKVISEGNHSGNTRKDAEGYWHTALWKTTESGEPDYPQTASAILEHLAENELKINGKPRKTKGNPIGLIKKRGEAIRKSTSDPRLGKKSAPKSQENPEIEDIYFQDDIAAKILAELNNLRELITKEAEEEKNAQQKKN